MLAATGSAVGLMLVYGLMRGLLVFAGDKLPRFQSIAFDTRIVLFALALAIVTPLVFGVGARISSRARNGRRRAQGRRAESYVWAAEGVAARFARRRTIRPRTDALGRRRSARPQLRAASADQRGIPFRAFRAGDHHVADRPLCAAEGEAVLSAVDRRASRDSRRRCCRRGRSAAWRSRASLFSADTAGPGDPETSRLIASSGPAGAYSDALGIPIKRGRVFTDWMDQQHNRVAIVNEQFVRLNWPGTDPIRTGFAGASTFPRTRVRGRRSGSSPT